MKNKILIAGLVIMASGLQVAAQNNPIFFGGNGDGSSQSAYLQLTSATLINHGGIGDGSSFAGYLQNILFITRGGIGDGTALSTSGLPTVDKIFFGGQADGIANASSGSPTVDKIFFGGIQDGNSFAASGSPTVDRIFYGGNGDGWASTYLPLSPLPLNLLSFTGEQQETQNLLRWRTATETNTSYFILERSATASNFSSLGRLAAAGNSSSEKDYEYPDAQPLNGNNFYRLKMVDADGKFTYSNIVLLKRLKDKSLLKIYPNPAASVLNIELSGRQGKGEVLVDIYDAAARLVSRKTIRKDNQVFQLNVQSLSAGVYSIRIIDQDEISTVKFIKN